MAGRRAIKLGPDPDLETAYLAQIPAGVERDAIRRDIHQARHGNFLSYLRLNGFRLDSTVANPQPLRVGDPFQKRLVALYVADLICCRVERDGEGRVVKHGCGKFHGIITHKIVQDKNGQPRLEPVTCPHCGMEDCAGPRKHAGVMPKYTGKTQVFVAHGVPFRLGLDALAGFRPHFVVISANQEEAERRKKDIESVLRRPMHEIIFGRATVPKKRSPAKSTRCEGWVDTIGEYFGWEKVPNGVRPAHWIWDDASNINTSILRPADGVKVRLKLESTVLQSTDPWTVIDIHGNICTPNDANSAARELAGREPGLWTGIDTWVTGEYPDFSNPWPEVWSKDWLCELYRSNPREFERVMMGKPLSSAEMPFQKFRFFTSGNKWDKIAPAIRDHVMKQDNPYILSENPKLALGRIRLLALDLAFTGEGSADSKKNRSQTAALVGELDPKTHNILVLAGKAGYVAAGDHLAYCSSLIETYGIRDLVMEPLGAQKEVIAAARQAGFVVHEYDPTTMGSKQYRKLPVADAINSGRVLLPGWPCIQFDAKGEMIVQEGMRWLYDALRLWPAGPKDPVDALEILVRTMWKLYGQFGADEAKPELEAEGPRFGTGWREVKPAEETSLVAAVDAMFPDDLFAGVLA